MKTTILIISGIVLTIEVCSLLSARRLEHVWIPMFLAFMIIPGVIVVIQDIYRTIKSK